MKFKEASLGQTPIKEHRKQEAADAKHEDTGQKAKIEQPTENRNVNEPLQYLKEYLDLENKNIERIKLLEAKNLPKHYQEQYEALEDNRLEHVTVALVPDDLWIKGGQPSESHAEKQLILIKESYYESLNNPDEAAWTCHELAHCKYFLDSGSPEEYQQNMQIPAFENIKTGHTYPNNKVEEYTFREQFKFLKKEGKTKEKILNMLKIYYKNSSDFLFFNRILDQVYG